MKLSVLIPMYNAESHIGNCLNSLLNQDYPEEDYEIIVIDDGSQDKSTKIVEAIQDSHKNVYLYSQKNAGLYATRNRLLKLAKGEYIYNLDADDYIVHNCLNSLLALAYKNDADILGFNSFKTTRTDLLKATRKNNEYNFNLYNGLEYFLNKKAFNTTVWWYFIKREYINKIKLTFKESNPFEDGPFTLRALYYSKKIVHVEADIHRYVQVQSSIMNSNDKKHLIKVINNYVDVSHSFNALLEEIVKQNEQWLSDITDRIIFFRDVNLYYMFFRIIKSDISISNINSILNELKKIKAYPLSYFIDSNLHKLIIYIFNHRYIFYTAVYPWRALYRLKMIT